MKTPFSDRFRASLIRVFETHIKHRQTFRYWRELETSQWLSPQELDRIQLAGLQRLLAYASDYCPYYRDTWRELGLRPDRVESVSDLAQWPVITKDTIRQHRQEMCSTATGVTLLPKTTGGSSGQPLAFTVTHDSLDRQTAASHRGYAWAGVPPGTKQTYLWGVPLGSQPAWRRRKFRMYHRVLYGRHFLSAFELSTDRVPQFLAEHNRFRPRAIVAYTNPLYEFARELKRKGLSPYSPRSIVVGAEKLHDFQRRLIEEVFQAPVFETYGCREFMLLGAECDRHRGLHLTAENLVIEILDDEGKPTPDGREGNVVITDLGNYGMPFIRYANGDRAVAGWGKCTCGRGLPMMTKVVGRQLDVLTTPDGRRVPGEFFPHLLKDFAAVERFQAVQTEPDRVVLKIIADDAWQQEDQARIEAEVRDVMGDSVRFTVQRVQEIPLTPTGKLKVVVNDCAACAEEKVSS